MALDKSLPLSGLLFLLLQMTGSNSLEQLAALIPPLLHRVGPGDRELGFSFFWPWSKPLPPPIVSWSDLWAGHGFLARRKHGIIHRFDILQAQCR